MEWFVGALMEDTWKWKWQRWITFIQYTRCRNIIHPTNNHNAGKKPAFFHRVQFLLVGGDRIEIVGGGLSQCSPSSLYWKTVRVKLGTEISYWSILSLKPMGLSHHTCSFSHSLSFHSPPVVSFSRSAPACFAFFCISSIFLQIIYGEVIPKCHLESLICKN